jgi:transmembrane sensor
MESNQADEITVLITRILEGEADPKDIDQLNKWISISESNKQYFEQIRNIWDASAKLTDPSIIDTRGALRKVINRISFPVRKENFWYYWQKIAAITFVPLIVASILLIYVKSYKTSSTKGPIYNELYASFGTRSAIRLVDSTLVWLNSGSILRYPDKFDEKHRQVFLKGEAYFEVKSDATKPFVVETPNFKVNATGTKFNVLDYESATTIEITLVSGKISVNGPGHAECSRLITELYPNQHLTINKKNGEKSIVTEETYKYISWKDGRLIFRNETLSKVVEKLSLYFNVDIELKGEELKVYRYRATFEDESLEEILRLLKLTAPIDIFEAKRIPLPDGSFPKKHVIIFPINKGKSP